jgi:hypothetical protein
MKFVLMFVLLGSGFSAYANTLVCKNSKTDLLDENVIMKIKGGVYEISHYGHSRNVYKASYAVSHSYGTRYGNSISLKKQKDESTWKDMPTSLTLDRHVTDGMDEFVLSGLNNTKNPYIYFNIKNCVQER